MRSILALQCAGPFAALAAFFAWSEDDTSIIEENYYAWWVTGTAPGDGVLVDCGPRPALLAGRKPPTEYRSPAVLLESVGVDAAAVRHVVLSHLHWDHIGGMEQFPAARLYVHRREYEFWLGDPIAQRAQFRAMADEESERRLAELWAAADGRLVVVADGDEIVPGVRVVEAPGHTPGLVALAVEAAHGTAVVASDAAHLFSNLETDTPSAFTYDRITCTRSYDRLRAAASREDLIFPGHDVRMANGYPRVAERVTRLV